jgi:hypothetical protein
MRKNSLNNIKLSGASRQTTLHKRAASCALSSSKVVFIARASNEARGEWRNEKKAKCTLTDEFFFVFVIAIEAKI